MQFSLEAKTASLSVGEFADFWLGPRESGADASGGLWRAQLGQHWHNELRRHLVATDPAAQFEVPVSGALVHRGWTVQLAGRIDQETGGRLREIKTVLRPLPAPEEELRRDYAGYFLQLAAYVVLRRMAGAPVGGADLVFVEGGSGLSQSVTLGVFDETLVHHQLVVLTDFLESRRAALARLRALRFTPPFPSLRPGQEDIQQRLAESAARSKIVLFEAPTGYGKTGCVLEFALGRLRAGRFSRLVWLTSKATGQLQVVGTLRRMTAPSGSSNLLGYSAESSRIGIWQVRPKREHCVNHDYHCLRETCGYLDGCAERWPASGLARFHLDPAHPRDTDTLRAAGREARVCPYEITRAALAHQEVWVGDFNYVFHPDSAGLFSTQPGFDPAQTLLVVDEAHNLPARAADARSHAVDGADLQAAYAALSAQRPLASLLLAWERWTLFVSRLRACDVLDPHAESDLRGIVTDLAPLVASSAIQHAALGPRISATLWQVPALADWLAGETLEKLLWSPQDGRLQLTCLDAAPEIGETLRAYGGAILLSATLSPAEEFARACGLVCSGAGSAPSVPPVLPAAERLGRLTRRETRKLYRQLTNAAEMLRVEEEAETRFDFLRAPAPWREGAYDVAVDLRVDTTLRQRERHLGTTAATIAQLRAASAGAVAVFFPSYAYAEGVAAALERAAPGLHAAVQPRPPDLAAQAAWIEEHLALSDALFLVLGGSFAESIDALGGRISHTMVVGPALPEVNAVQRARLASAEAALGRDAAFRRAYLVPGLLKVNQALGRLVRAPGQRAKILLHCRRFAEPRFAGLLAPEYQLGRHLATDGDLADWLG